MDNYKVNDNGYIRVYIYNKTFALHRLIALAFVKNTENKEQVNHIDGNKLNNSVENLEWVSNQENQIHKFKIGLGNNFTRKITQFDLEMNKIKDFNSIAEASKELNIGKSSIGRVLHHFSFNMPLSGAEMTGLEPLLCASSMRKGVKPFCSTLDVLVQLLLHFS